MYQVESPGSKIFTPKRFMDLLGALLLGLLAFPVLVLAALTIRCTSKGPVLHKQSRIGRGNRWNVLVGDMSLIGLRPIALAEIQTYGPDYAVYERVRPGLTALWQVSGRNDTTYQQRVDYDSYYVRNWSLRLDIKILCRTLRAVISGIGAY